jgi:hypothetical protein
MFEGCQQLDGRVVVGDQVLQQEEVHIASKVLNGLEEVAIASPAANVFTICALRSRSRHLVAFWGTFRGCSATGSRYRTKICLNVMEVCAFSPPPPRVHALGVGVPTVGDRRHGATPSTHSRSSFRLFSKTMRTAIVVLGPLTGDATE